jgi:hypothetical protein
MAKAKEDATSFFGGGIEKTINDLQSYGATLGVSGASFLLSHIPFVGTEIAMAFDLASKKGINKAYELLREKATSREKRIIYTLFLLERSVSATLRQAYNTVKDYDAKASRDFPCDDCQDAYREARSSYLAQDCVDDMVAGCKMLEELVADLKAEIGILKGKTDSRVSLLASRIDEFRGNHKKSTCMGLNRCYFLTPPGRVTVPTVGSHIKNDDL